MQMLKFSTFFAAGALMGLATVFSLIRPAFSADADPDGHLWPLAMAIQEIVASPPLKVESAFKEEGWNRIADRLSVASEQELATAKSDPAAFVRSLLNGKDRDAYCAQLDKFASGGQLDVPIELMQARDAGAAIAPYIDELADYASSRPGEERMRQAVLAKIGQIVLNDRLVAEIEQFEGPLTSGALVVSKPKAWPSSEAWPLDQGRLDAILDALRHVEPSKLRICSAAPLPVKGAKAISDAHDLASALVSEVESWAKDYSSGSAGLSDVARLPYATAPSISIAAVADPGKEWLPRIALVPSVVNPGSYAVAIEAEIAGKTVQWPLGLGVDEVKLDDQRKPFFVPRSLVPNVSKVDKVALRSALLQVGVPPAISFLAEGTATVSPNFDRVDISIPFALASIVQGNLQLVLIRDGKSEIATSIKQELARIAGDVASRLKSRPPKLQFAGDAISIEGGQVAVEPTLTQATIEGRMRIRPGGGDTALLGNDLVASVKLAVPLDGSAVRLVETKWPEGVIERLQSALVARLPASKIDVNRCIGISGIVLTLDDSASVVVSVTLIADGKTASPFLLKTQPLLKEVASQFAALAGDKAVQQCIARQIVKLVSEDYLKALADLRTRKIPIAGILFRVTPPDIDIKDPDGKVRFRANLVADDDPTLVISGVTIDGDWKAGSPLSISAINVDGVRLPPAFAKRLIGRFAPGINDWISISGMAFGRGVLTIDGSVSVPGLQRPISFSSIALDLSKAGADLQRVLGAVVLEGISRALDQVKDRIASIGAVKDISLDTQRTNLIDPGNLQVWFKVGLYAEGLAVVTIPVLVELPHLKVVPDGDVSSALIGAALGPFMKYLGGVAAGSGVSNIRSVVDPRANRYGAMFDAGVKVAGIVEVKVQDVIVTQRGFSLPDRLQIVIPAAPTPLPPLPLQLIKLGGMISLNPPGRFGADAEVTIVADETGALLKLVAAVEGDPTTQRISTNGELYVLTIPMFRAEGSMEFRRGSATLDVKTLKPLSSILDIRGHAAISRNDISALAGLDLLGLKQSGQLNIDLRGGSVLMVGKASFTDLGEAAVSLKTNKNFRNPTAQGSVQIGFLDLGADVGLGVSYASLRFHWHSIGLKVIAPSVGRINAGLIRDLINSLFDFRLDFKNLKNITINLLDKNGNKTDESYGGGSAPSDSDSSSQQTGDGVAEGAKKAEVHSADQQDSDGKGDSSVTGPAKGLCSNERSGSGRAHIWATAEQLGKDVFIEADHEGNTNWISTDARIITLASRNSLETGTELDCVERKDSGQPALTFHFSDGDAQIKSDLISIFTPQGGQDRLLALEYYKGAVPVEILLPGNTTTAIFGKTGLSSAVQWKPSRFQHNLLSRVVNKQLNKIAIKNVTAVPPVTIVPAWKGKPASLIEETSAGKNIASLENENGAPAEFAEGSRFYPILLANPAGPFASLAASVPSLSSLTVETRNPLELRPQAGGNCQLVLADAEGEANQYAVAFTKQAYGVARLTGPRTRILAERGWLDAHCGRIAALGANIELYAMQPEEIQDGTSSETLIVARAAAVADRLATWWLARTRMQADTKVSARVEEICAPEADFIKEIPSSAVKSDAARNFLSGDHAKPSLMLRDLIEPRSVWSEDFYVSPRGFLQSAVKTNKCPEITAP